LTTQIVIQCFSEEEWSPLPRANKTIKPHSYINFYFPTRYSQGLLFKFPLPPKLKQELTFQDMKRSSVNIKHPRSSWNPGPL